MLTPQRVTQLKTALNAQMFKDGVVVPGFRVYRRVAGGLIIPVTIVGRPCREAIRRIQRINGLPVTGEFDDATQNFLIPVPKTKGGDKVWKQALHGVSLAPRHYTQGRPTATTWDEFVRVGSDCSGFAAICFHEAGLPNPNGGPYNGYGNTWSLIAKGAHVATAQLEPGDLVFYGPRAGDPTHVTIYGGNGRVAGHGHEGAPVINALDYIDDASFHRIDQRRYPGES